LKILSPLLFSEEANFLQRIKSSYVLSTFKITAFIIVIAISFMACAENRDAIRRVNRMPQKTIEEVLRESNSKLLSVPGVVGTAQSLCDSKPCIKVYVIQISSELTRQIPDMIGGYPVIIEEVGQIHTLPENQNK
jgi:hypothetical protein